MSYAMGVLNGGICETCRRLRMPDWHRGDTRVSGGKWASWHPRRTKIKLQVEDKKEMETQLPGFEENVTSWESRHRVESRGRVVI